ncbi:MAG TPA: ABC transporter ATP-binding protein [Candidatus Kapabacteria bacterium]|nr:ABC transporter ATP-binding protein [Candidatus Kapabacteria bacterium]
MLNSRAVPLLEIQDLTLDFAGDHGSVRALDGVSFSVAEGETVCLVGESGSGKTVTAMSIGRLLPSPAALYQKGSLLVDGRDVLRMNKRELRTIRGGVVNYVFQEPGAALNPVFRVGQQIMESLKLHQPAHATDAEVIRLLNLVGIPAPEIRARSYPHQMSGGMQQRIMIAMAIASRPKLLVADEPTTALDVTIQAQILKLLRDLQKQLGMAILLITHNLRVVQQIADRVIVMYAGQVVEQGRADEVIRHPHHPYTRALLKAVPEIGAGHERLLAIPGSAPQPGAWPTGCRFHPRCPQRQTDCHTNSPNLADTTAGRCARCMYWELTPPVEPHA